ncbi:MAG TPA: hypothetical protein VH302_11540 [Bryobacteraceae bacterium]|jgi:hypothetical protein|nr:hypothetical protein [Bryobacteraceae bacterium]
MRTSFLGLIVLVYATAAITREFLPGREGWVFGLLAFHLAAAWALRFLTNATAFSWFVTTTLVVLEIALFLNSRSITATIWTGTTMQAAFAVWFARRFYLTMGD